MSETSAMNIPISTNILVLSNIFYPVFDQLESNNDVTNNLRRNFFQLEELYPGFARLFLQSFVERQMSTPFNPNELTLKMEKFCDKTAYLISSSAQSNKDVQELNLRASHLKEILSRIPDDIIDKRQFLETIKEIASAIKKTLDSVSMIYQHLKSIETRQIVEAEKKEFIKASKHFSNTLKSYFRDNQRDEVYISSNHLLVQTDYLLRTIQNHLESTNSNNDHLYPLHRQFQQEMKLLNGSTRISTSSVKS